jgi:hypothetical protein
MNKAGLRAEFDAGLPLLPYHMVDGLTAYLEHGREVGGFLTSVLQGDNDRALLSADPINKAIFNDGWLVFMKKHMPEESHGSPLKVKAWQKMGGLAGLPDDAP